MAHYASASGSLDSLTRFAVVDPPAAAVVWRCADTALHALQTGRLHNPSALREIVGFLADNNIDVICDEIYAGRCGGAGACPRPRCLL